MDNPRTGHRDPVTGPRNVNVDRIAIRLQREIEMTETEISTDEQAPAGKAKDLEERLVAEGEIAGDYLEELLDLLDFDGDIDLDVEGDRAIVSIDGGDDLSKLVGRRGEVLDPDQLMAVLADQSNAFGRRRDRVGAHGDDVLVRLACRVGQNKLVKGIARQREMNGRAHASAPS